MFNATPHEAVKEHHYEKIKTTQWVKKSLKKKRKSERNKTAQKRGKNSSAEIRTPDLLHANSSPSLLRHLALY